MNDLARHFAPALLRQLMPELAPGLREQRDPVAKVAAKTRAKGEVTTSHGKKRGGSADQSVQIFSTSTEVPCIEVPKTNERAPTQPANENVSTVPSTAIKARKAHIWKQEDNGHYVEPRWVSKCLFEVETFEGDILDPCCGFGNIVTSATEAGLVAIGADLVDRGFDELDHTGDFLAAPFVADNVVMNPPFHDGNPQRFVEHALNHARRKVACVFTQARLNAAHWLKRLPLRRVWLLSPRPSMPPGWKYREYQADGKEASGDTKEYCWLLFEQGHIGEPSLGWLHRDGEAA